MDNNNYLRQCHLQISTSFTSAGSPTSSPSQPGPLPGLARPFVRVVHSRLTYSRCDWCPNLPAIEHLLQRRTVLVDAWPYGVLGSFNDAGTRTGETLLRKSLTERMDSATKAFSHCRQRNCQYFQSHPLAQRCLRLAPNPRVILTTQAI